MTTAYVVQVALAKSVKYLGASGKLQTTPKFFLSAPAVRQRITTSPPGGDMNDWRYDHKKHHELTKVITIRDLQLGLKDSKADIHFYGEWLQLPESGKAKRLKTNPNAMYKIQLANGKLLHFGPGAKFGKVWTAAGHLRSHITQQLGFNPSLFSTHYAGAKVVEIEMIPPGIDVKKITYHAIRDFYTMSPDCSKRLVDIEQTY